MRLFFALIAISTLLVACSGSPSTTAQPTAAPTTAAATSAPTTAAVLTNPPPTQIPGCLPQCWFGQLTRPGPLSGDYTTKYFFGGQLTLTVPPDGWVGREDSTGELAIQPAGREDAAIEFWLDLQVAADPNGTPDASYERTAEGLMAFVEQEQGITIVDRKAATIGGLPAQAIEYRRAKDAINQDPGCPTEIQPCIFEFTYPEWDGSFGEAGPFHSRFWIAKAQWGGEVHAVYAMLWADDNSCPEFIDAATAMIEGAQLPKGVETAPFATAAP